MPDTTSILDLPTDPVGGGTIGGNISFSANEKINMPQLEASNNGNLSLDQTTINQIVSGLQQASSTGATQLQSRDIPRTTESIVQDPQVQPNFIPPQSNRDYILEQESKEDIIQSYSRNEKYEDSLDQLYDEFQVPLLIGVLYFLFQLPIFKKNLFKFFPVLFSKDGNINLYGYIFTSSLFGMLYYMLSKTMTHFSRF